MRSRARYFRFSVFALLAATLVVSLFLGWPHIRRRQLYRELLRFADKEYQQLALTDREYLAELVEKLGVLLSDSSDRRIVVLATEKDDLVVCQYEEFNRNEEFNRTTTRLIISVVSPGTTRAAGDHQGLGMPDEISFIAQDNIRCVCVKEEWHGVLREAHRLFFSIDGPLLLVRCELMAEDKGFSGTWGASKDYQQWADELHSSNDIEVLAALASVVDPPLDDATPLKKKVAERLSALRQHPHPWIREGAQVHQEYGW